MGATNPLILSGARHYPHILRISPPLPDETPVQGVFGALSKSAASQSFKDAQASPHGLFSARKRHIRKDRPLLKAVEEKIRSNDCKLRFQHLSILPVRLIQGI